jgi:hypothetical protein
VLNKIANAIKSASASAPNMLLTATPLQHPAGTLRPGQRVDDHVFGDIDSFRNRYARGC